MRLYEGKIPTMARELVSALIKGEDLEVEPRNVSEVELDVQAVLREYVRAERELTELAKDMVEARKMSYSDVGRMKARLAKDKNFGLNDEALDYIILQLIEIFYNSNHVEEVFADDNGLRKQIAPVLRKHMEDVDQQLDQEVRGKLRNLQEGSRAWDIEYEKAMQSLKRLKKLE